MTKEMLFHVIPNVVRNLRGAIWSVFLVRLGPSHLDRAGAADDGLGAVGFLAPGFDFGPDAIALGPPLDDPSVRPGGLVAPQHVHQPEIHFAAVHEAQPE